MSPFNLPINLPIYIQFLTDDFARRKTKNPIFSMRAYARLLGIDPGTLSRVLSGQQRLSLQSGVQIVKRLDLTQDEQNQLLESLVEERKEQAWAFISTQLESSEDTIKNSHAAESIIVRPDVDADSNERLSA